MTNLLADMSKWEQPDYLCTNITKHRNIPRSLLTLDGLQRLSIDGSGTELEFEGVLVRITHE